MNKLPAEMRLIMSHKLGTGRWDVEEMMKTINLEVEVRERSAIGPHHQRKPPSRSTPPTSSTLYRNTEQSGQCVYCGQSHTSTTCTIASDVDGRTEILCKADRCYVCLKKHHGSRNCHSRIDCDHCRGIITPLCAHTWIRAPLMLILHWVNEDWPLQQRQIPYIQMLEYPSYYRQQDSTYNIHTGLYLISLACDLYQNYAPLVLWACPLFWAGLLEHVHHNGGTTEVSRRRL